MTLNQNSTLTINVDLCNPGQFFACCGLLELAHRKWGCKAQGKFDEDIFCLFAPGNFNDLVKNLTISPINTNSPTSPISIHKEKHVFIYLDWWLQDSGFKTWSGQQSSYGILTNLYKESLNEFDIASGFEYTSNLTGRLSVDYRASWTGLDAGFSPNSQDMAVATYPLVEFLAAIGLQRFRPNIVQSKSAPKKYCYSVWHEYLSVSLACVASYAMPIQTTEPYEFVIKKRGQYKYFSKANKTRI